MTALAPSQLGMEMSESLQMPQADHVHSIGYKLKDAAFTSLEAAALLIEKSAHAARERLHERELAKKSMYEPLHMPTSKEALDKVAQSVQAVKETLFHKLQEMRAKSPRALGMPQTNSERIGENFAAASASGLATSILPISSQSVVGNALNAVVGAAAAGLATEATETALQKKHEQTVSA